MPSYTVFDFSLGYSGQLFGQRVSASIMMENATDHIYLQGQNNIFADPRKIYFNVAIRF